MKLRKLANYLFVFTASAIGLLIVLLVGDSIISNYGYFAHFSHDSASNALMRTCVEHNNSAFVRNNDQSLSQPTYSDDQLIAWLNDALPNIMTFNHSNIRQTLMDGEQYFTPDGWCHFLDALATANIIDATIGRKLEVTIVLQGAPKVTRELVENGFYTWYLDTPVSFQFKSDEAGTIAPPDINNEKLVVKISRSSSKTNPLGLGISQWITVSDH